MTKIPKILLIYTGGTIGMVEDYDTGSLIPFDFDELLKHIPELHHLNCSIDSCSFDKPIDSSNMNPKYWVKITELIEEKYQKYDGFVVLHGSDTMAYTASAVSFMFENLSKPVIFTGSQLPIGSIRTDAKENLITSIQIASAQKGGKAVVSEVGLYFEYKLYRANRTTKISAEHFSAFSSPNFPTLAESGVHLKFNESALLHPKRFKKIKIRKILETNIALIKIFPGINEMILNSMLTIEGLKGVILESYGAGNAPTDSWFIDSLTTAIKKGIKIINVTQCAAGTVLLGHYETSDKLKSIGVISGKDITTEAAIAKLMYLLAQKIPNHQFEEAFLTSLRGEITV